MNGLSLPGIGKLLRRLRIVYKRGRASVHSPDLAYNEKLAAIAAARARSQAEPTRFPFLYEDETSCEGDVPLLSPGREALSAGRAHHDRAGQLAGPFPLNS